VAQNAWVQESDLLQELLQESELLNVALVPATAHQKER
jgi:hypothetical protein